ncbi:MAG: peptide MFS transporter [Prevotellaceae bacterium]|nr:peptide MFS transporter [Prevotellaceae bacterium]
MFEGQPKGLWTLAIANTGERFGYYTMLAVFTLFLGAKFGFSEGVTSNIYACFLMMAYFLPLLGGIAADLWGYSRMVVIGISVMFFGYLLLSIPLGADWIGISAMGAALLLVCVGTGLFKGNLQVMVGDLYNDPRYADKRDSGFSLFYMLINVGALFAPTAAIKMMDWAQTTLSFSKADSYHFAFSVACVSVIVSMLIYFLGRSTYKQVLTPRKKQAKTAEPVEQLSKSETKERIVCLCLVFAVVIFFWMAFGQNGLTLTWFADEFTAREASGAQGMMFDVLNLSLVIVAVFALFSLFQSKKTLGKVISAFIIVAIAVILGYRYTKAGTVAIDAPIFQQFNPGFVVGLTPVSIALFSWLAKKGREPKAPVKIGLGMLVAALAYLIMMLYTLRMPMPQHPQHVYDATPNLLVTTYLIMTFAELLLSPIGISFVSKVAPPKFRGMMMGGWFVATAIGNLLSAVPGHMWSRPLPVVWGTLMVICLVAALLIFAIIRKLNRVA